MKKFTSIYKEKFSELLEGEMAGVKIMYYKKAKEYFVLSKRLVRFYENFLLLIMRSYPTFGIDEVVIYRKEIPFYTAEVKDFLEEMMLDYIEQIPIFFWVFSLALHAVVYEKVY